MFAKLCSSLNLYISPNEDNNRYYLCKYVVCSILSLVFCWDSNYMYVRSFDLVPHTLEALFFFNFSLFFSPSSLTFSHPYYLLGFFFKIFRYCIFHVNNAHLFPFIVSISLLFHCKHTFTYILEYFYNCY